MVFDYQVEYSLQWKAIESLAAMLSVSHVPLELSPPGMPTPGTGTQLRLVRGGLKKLHRAYGSTPNLSRVIADVDHTSRVGG